MKNRREFNHIKDCDRDEIEILLRKGYKQKEIAETLGFHDSTIGREIRKHKNKDGIYRARSAKHKVGVKRSRSKYQGMKIENLPKIKKRIIAMLKEKRSPDEIAGRLKKECVTPVIGKDCIYRWLYSVWGQRYCKYLCTQRYKPRRQKENKTQREMIKNAVSIHSKEIVRIFDQEGDTLVTPQKLNKKDAIAITVGVSVPFISARKIPNMKPRSMKEAVLDILDNVKCSSLILDRGGENRSHEEFGVPTYFCDPHAPWQKPRVESNIGLLRRWFLPKGSDLSKVSNDELQEYIKVLNGKYRKSLGYRSAYEVALECGMIKKLE